MKLQIETSQNVLIEYEIATLGERIGAALIDYVVMTIYFYFIFILASSLTLYGSDDGMEGWIWLLILLAIPWLAYHLLSETFMDGQSIGKKALRIKVAKVDGSQAGIGEYLLRWLMWFVEGPMWFGSLSAVVVLINGRGQRLGDIAAGTAVVKLPRNVSLRETILARLPEDYQPTYPNVTILSDRDITTIREVLASRERSENHVIINTLVKRLEAVLDVHNTDRALPFLRTIIKDYTWYAARM